MVDSKDGRRRQRKLPTFANPAVASNFVGKVEPNEVQHRGALLQKHVPWKKAHGIFKFA